MSSTFVSHFFVGATAAAAFECLKVYDLRHKLSSKKYVRLIRSAMFWAVVVGMLAASGFFTWVFYAERPNATAAELALAGIAARSLIRDGITAFTAKRSVKLGANDDQKLSFRDVLQ